MKKVSELIDVASNQEVAYLSENSQDIKDNTLFFCLKGANFDAHLIVDEVIDKGAKVIVHTDPIVNKRAGIIYYQSQDINSDMALIAQRFFDYPANKLNLIGITGTNGKTSIGWILYYLLNKLSNKTGYIGTIDIEYNNQVYKNLFTTPKPIELNYHLNKMVEQGVKNCALEVSSHALIMERTKGLNIKYAIMTNLTFEHINFHGSMSEYQLAKRKLFEQLKASDYAILNIDDLTYDDYAQHTKAKVLSYGLNKAADLSAKNIKLQDESSSFTLVYQEKEYIIETNLVALFNIYNLLAVLAVLLQEGYQIAEISKLLTNIELPQGRMERFNFGTDFSVIVDYAHTPDGFEQVFRYAKKIKKGKIIAVFGSAGGDRDKEKRPVLGEIADLYADEIILTQEDERNEAVLSIANEIATGIKKTPVTIVEKRSDSIMLALNQASKGDLILILAKANDKYNIGLNNVVNEYEGDIDIVKRMRKEMGYENE